MIRRILCRGTSFTAARFLKDRSRISVRAYSKSMSGSEVEKNFDSLFKKIDELKPRFIERLAKGIEIPAVSGDESLRPQVVKKAHYLADELKKLGFSDIELRELGTQPPPVADPNLQLPPVILARYGNDPTKKTVLVYGHYDVQPANLEDGWNTDPF